MNINETMRELAQYTRLQEEAATMVEVLEDQLKRYMVENQLETLAGDEHKASYKTVTASRIDTAALKRDLPGIATAYTKQTEAKRFVFV